MSDGLFDVQLIHELKKCFLRHNAEIKLFVTADGLFYHINAAMWRVLTYNIRDASSV